MVDFTSAISNASALINKTNGIGDKNDKKLSENFDTFLSLLTTQLKNQDPMAPMDTDKFTQQLNQYSQVEQLIQSNKNLEALVQLSTANTSLGLINYVGKETVIEGSEAALNDGKADWRLSLPENASNVTYVVKDANGNEVYSRSGSLSAGDATFSWDGSKSDGGTAAPGTYTLTVNATNANNKPVGVDVNVRGIVEGVDMTGASPKLLINGKEYDINQVREIHMAS